MIGEARISQISVFPNLPYNTGERDILRAAKEDSMPLENSGVQGIARGLSSPPMENQGSVPAPAVAYLYGQALRPKRGIPLSLDWVRAVRINTSAVERRAQSHVARRTAKKEWQAAWLLRAISCMDLTTLAGDDTEERVRRLCSKARQPVKSEVVKRLGIEGLGLNVAAI